MLSPNSRARLSHSRSPSPNETQLGGTKRKRKALSCYDCRRRKLKCDREYPSCNRCWKGGIAHTCSYDERSLEPVNHGSSAPPPAKQFMNTPQTSSNWSFSNPVTQFQPIPRVEKAFPSLEASQTSGVWQHGGEVSTVLKDDEDQPTIKADSETFLTSPRPRTPTETIIFRGENFRTQYYGGSNPTSLIAHFPELRSFMKEAITQHTSLPRVQRDLKALQVRWKGEKVNPLPLTDPELFQLLPSQETVDHLIRLYFDTFGALYCILHGPTFWKEYQMLWQEHEAAQPSFIIIVLLMMAAVACSSLREQPTYVGDSALARERAVLWIEVSEWWLGCQSRKHIYLGIWQIRCLLLISKQVNIAKKKRTWTTAGTLVREAMSAGFHRDPTLLGSKVSAFDQEMRRRLWATMTELELQTSIDRGMPSASAGVPSDSATVLNIDDEDLVVSSGDPPTPKAFNHYTSASYLNISRASFSLRVTLNSLVNDMSSPSRYEEVLNYEEMVTEQLKKLPPCRTSGETRRPRELPGLVRTLLDVQLRQFLILLHAPFARQSGSNSRYSVSRMICFNAAASILEQHTQLVKSGSYILLLLRHDYFRGALAISHNLHLSMSIKSDFFLNSSSSTLITYIENALFLFEDRITRLGTGYTHYWYISAACALVRSTMSPEQSIAQKQQAIDRVAKQYYRVLASQEDITKVKDKLLPGRVNKMNVLEDQFPAISDGANPAGLSFLDGSMPQLAFNEADQPLEEFYFGDPAAWTFDNLWALE